MTHGTGPNYGHVPEERLEEYRKIMKLSHSFGSLGSVLSGRGEYRDANTMWALESKYKQKAMELRVVRPSGTDRA